ncbi:MAG: TonB-dependent receptor [Bacteroidetes bacterium]|jgi:outer membrane receptor for ferrienterochelin and colicins|nr:TonB-dependent receptor [Bacteroidota bacterium]MBT7463340.1 TonB-dependent receptor [Bacteroidota bacterium]
MINRQFVKAVIFVFYFVLIPVLSFSQEDSIDIYRYSLKDLAEVKISTGSIKKAPVNVAPSNITIITKQMIDERGYQTLVDVCQDIPGFDFMMFNDGGGEYPGYSKNRGLGEIGNPEILIMINGIIQNSISFNWSLLWTYENMFIDVQQIEIIQGPGSVMYGAQAFTGVINIITRSKFSGVEAMSSYGSFNTWRNDIHLGANLNEDIHLSLALHQYHSDGDKGLNRFDPGGYYKNNYYPDIILADYDNEGNYVQNTANPLAGKLIPDGFNTSNMSQALRGGITYKKTEFGLFISEYTRGNSSINTPYEYDIAARESVSGYKTVHSYLENSKQINPKLNLNSLLVFRTGTILPITGFRYLYRFPELTKSYASYAYQTYIEEKLLYELSPESSVYIGIKAAYNRKNDRIISLGTYNNSHTSTNSSWIIAKEGGGLNQIKEYPVTFEKEVAAYALWDKKWFSSFSTSLGMRYDFSSNFGSILNPRLALMYNPKPAFGAKFLFGSAFRQAGIFELISEFRGNPNLLPERIRTGELEFSSLLLENKIALKANIFYSTIRQYIGKVPDSTMPAGERFENLDRIDITGISLYFSCQVRNNIRIYSNYSYMLGYNAESAAFYEIDGVAKQKFNAGINFKSLKDKIIVDFRINYVGKRKANITNIWIQTYENGFAPSYLKANLSVSYKFMDDFTFQLIGNNIFNEQYYGLGRETGSSFIDSYDPQNNINPAGHIPAYHPQPGRTISANLIYKF